ALRVQIPDCSCIGRRPQLTVHERNFVTLDQPARMLYRFWRAVGIIKGDIVDLAPANPAAIVDRLDVSYDPLADGADRRSWPAERKDAADPDFCLGDARHLGCVNPPDR